MAWWLIQATMGVESNPMIKIYESWLSFYDRFAAEFVWKWGYSQTGRLNTYSIFPCILLYTSG